MAQPSPILLFLSFISSTLQPLLFAHISSSPQNMLYECQQKNSFNMNQNNIICFKSSEIEPAFRFMLIEASTNIFLDENLTWSITGYLSWSSLLNFYFQSSQ